MNLLNEKLWKAVLNENVLNGFIFAGLIFATFGVLKDITYWWVQIIGIITEMAMFIIFLVQEIIGVKKAVKDIQEMTEKIKQKENKKIESKKNELFFSRAFMNGATLFGVGLTVLALSSALNFTGNQALFFAIVGYSYLALSILAFFFPKLSEEKIN